MKKFTNIEQFSSVIELIRHFDSEAKCAEYLAQKRWNGNPVCPKCGHTSVYTLKGKTQRYKCAGCREQFSVRVGTIFEASPIKLQTWFLAVYLVTAHKKGISSLQLSRDLNVTQKTAWFMLHRIRYAMGMEPVGELDGTVEVDETKVGGRMTNRHKSKRVKGASGGQHMETVVGLVERGGKVKAMQTADRSATTLQGIINANVAEGSTIMTDEWHGYDRVHHAYDHRTIAHAAGEYVVNGVHTNTIEGFWSLLKRGIIGIYHQTSKKHLQAYVNEFTYRYNLRGMHDSARFADMCENLSGRLTYKTLIND